MAAASVAPWLPPHLPRVGVGWRWEIDDVVAALLESGRLGFVEVVAEVLPRSRGARLPRTLRQALDAGVAVIPHGVGLGAASAWPVSPSRISTVAQAARMCKSPLVSEHIAFVRAPVRGEMVEVGHLLPVPRTAEALAALERNITAVRECLRVPLVLEPIATVVDPGGDLAEPEFVTELVRRTGVGVLLDVANVYANAVNSGLDPFAELARYPLHAVRYCHVAGGRWHHGVYLDTHTDPVPPEVFDLVKHLVGACSAAGVETPGFLLERDGSYDGLRAMVGELDALADAACPVTGVAV